MYFNQQEFDIRCEWGEQGVAVLAPASDVVIIIDVLSFCTSVEIATARGAFVFPFRGSVAEAENFAGSVDALLARPGRRADGYSLSPASLMSIESGTRIVLPSPNGSTLSLTANPTPVIAGCLRNAHAVAIAAQKYGARIAVIPAGERWLDRISLRPSFEDLVGAGAIIHALPGSRSPEAALAEAAFHMAQPHLEEQLRWCSSGKELIERGFAEDVSLAAQLNVSTTAPALIDGAYFTANEGDPSC
jgi:2-phosphosulfolactate phosphatase